MWQSRFELDTPFLMTDRPAAAHEPHINGARGHQNGTRHDDGHGLRVARLSKRQSIRSIMMSRGSSTLVPDVRQWTNARLLEHLLRRGPKSFDPNLEKEHMDGWHDDDREFTNVEFERAIGNVLATEEHPELESRTRIANATLESEPIRMFIDGLVFLQVVAPYDADRFKRSLAETMARNHVERWHRLRLVPVDTVRAWKVDGISQVGIDDCLVFLPIFLRHGYGLFNPRDLRLAIVHIRDSLRDRDGSREAG